MPVLNNSHYNTLNTIPKFRMSGENENKLFITSQLESNLHKDNRFVDEKEFSGGAWRHNAIPSQAMACPTMQQILSIIDPPPHETLMQLNPGHPSFEEHEASSIIGAKMIRIQSGTWKANEAVAYFQKNFPCHIGTVFGKKNPLYQQEKHKQLGELCNIPSSICK